MNGYKEAEIIDKIINRLLKDEPITKENIGEWLHFSYIVKMNLLTLDLKVINNILNKIKCTL